jgi:dTDP-4-amino-4,6-dideoxygalactose transaminase
MSGPVWIGPTPADRAEWKAMYDLMTASRHDPREVEAALERKVAGIVERPFAIAFASLGAAIEASLQVLGIGRDIEVVAPALGPIAFAAAASRIGARVLYADVDSKSMSLRELHASARLTSATRAIVGCALHGQSAGLDELAALASRNEIPLLEILVGGLGGRLGRDPVGRFGRIAVVSLGERDSCIGSGGAVCVTNDDSLAHALRLARNLGMLDPRHEWERIGGIPRVERLGLDSRICSMSAALGCVRLERFDETCEALEGVFHGYLRRLAMHPDLVLPAPCVDGTVRWSHFAVRLGERYSRDDRDAIVQGLLRHDIAATIVAPVLPLEPAFAEHHSPGDFPVAERAADRLIALPFSTAVGEREIDLICQTLQVMIERQSIMRA